MLRDCKKKNTNNSKLKWTMTARAAENYIVIATFAKLYEVESVLVSAQAQKFPAARRGLAEVRTSNDGSY